MWKYVALFVPDLRAAETFYCDVFQLELLFRETHRDGGWFTVRPEIDWAEADTRGVPVDMVALRGNGFVLALFRGNPQAGTIHELCVEMSEADLATARAGVSRSVSLLEDRPRSIRFEDPFGFRWAVHVRGMPFRSSGEIAGRWIG